MLFLVPNKYACFAYDYLLKDHLGNVLVTVSDKKIPVDVAPQDGIIDYYTADVITANDYYPFGMALVGRKYAVGAGQYRYGFNGKEKSDEIAEGDLDFGNRVYDSRLGKWFSLDPSMKKNCYESNYAFVSNSPLLYADADGKDKIIVITIIGKDGLTTQIRKIDRSYFSYRLDHGMGNQYYTKADVHINLIIDNYGRDKPMTAQEALNEPSRFEVSREEVNRVDIGAGEYLFGKIKNFLVEAGDQSESVQYGYRMYGEGTDMAWQDGLPKVGIDLGNEDLNEGAGIDLKYILQAAGALREGTGLEDGAVSPKREVMELLSNPMLKKLFEGADNILDGVQTYMDASGTEPPYKDYDPLFTPGNIIHYDDDTTKTNYEVQKNGGYERTKKSATDTVKTGKPGTNK
jgi:RHS repeat-associated protein